MGRAGRGGGGVGGGSRSSGSRSGGSRSFGSSSSRSSGRSSFSSSGSSSFRSTSSSSSFRPTSSGSSSFGGHTTRGNNNRSGFGAPSPGYHTPGHSTPHHTPHYTPHHGHAPSYHRPWYNFWRPSWYFRPTRTVVIQNQTYKGLYEQPAGYRPRYAEYGPEERIRYAEYDYHKGVQKARVGFVVFLLVILAIVCGGILGVNTYSQVESSTVAREALSATAVNQTEYYYDELGWVSGNNALINGMKKFQSLTGIQPYLYITDNIQGSYRPTDSAAEAWMESYYDDQFTDEAHLLVVFHEYDEQYTVYYVGGTQTKAIFDNEAGAILFDYMDEYYYSDYDEDTMFGKVFEKTATRMMTVSEGPWKAIIAVIIVIGVIATLFAIITLSTTSSNLRRLRDAELLSIPIDRATSDEDEVLNQKYDQL